MLIGYLMPFAQYVYGLFWIVTLFQLILQLCGKYRNELKAVEHYRRHLLLWTVAAWRSFVAMMQRDCEAEQARQTTQNKMAAFLNAAALGQLWTDRPSKTTAEETEAPCGSDGIVTKQPAVCFIAVNLGCQF